MSKTSLYQQVIEAVEALSIDDQRELINTLNLRFNLRQRQQIMTEIKEVQEEYQSGKVKFDSVNDFLEELDIAFSETSPQSRGRETVSK